MVKFLQRHAGWYLRSFVTFYYFILCLCLEMDDTMDDRFLLKILSDFEYLFLVLS